MDKQNILVIGGAGYIGSHIVDELCNAGHNVTVFDNLSLGFRENLHSNASLIVGDILNASDLNKAFSKNKFDAVFHFAALKNVGESMIKIEKYAENNIIGTINVLNAMSEHNVRFFIFSSSAAVYGSPKYFPMDENHPANPENFYGFTKLEIERFLEWYSRISKINYAALRYFNAAGYSAGHCMEKNPGNLLPIIMEAAAGMRTEVQVYGDDFETEDGTGVRDYIHVCDLASAHLMAMEYIINHRSNIVVNLSTEKGSSVLEIIKAAQRITGRDIKYRIVERRAGDPAVVVASSALAKKLLGWTPVHSDIDTIIKSMWHIYQEKGRAMKSEIKAQIKAEIKEFKGED